ncbi:MAG: S8 family serine peptidase, partial [Candidatus Hermodarchaeota archaeon]
DIISALYLEVDVYELIEKEYILKDFNAIQRIFKSKIYQNPYILDNDLQVSALSVDSYPNWWLSAIGAEDLPYNGTGVRVAVIDTGIYEHPDLNVVENRNFVTGESSSNYNDNIGHGTHVAGIIGGNGEGSSGEYRGVAPGVMLINARVGGAVGFEEGEIIDAINWASKPVGLGGAGADIISMSFGRDNPVISDSLINTISSAKQNYGVIFVSSAGNSGPEYFTGSSPASGIDVISVGATDENNTLASFSSLGPTFGYLNYPDIVAPGVNIISTNAEDSIFSKEMLYIGDFFDFSGDADYIPLSGTSMSCPMVAGALAILKDAFPTVTPETARIALLEGARTLSNEDEDDFLKSGRGLINVSASLEYLNSLAMDYNDTAKVYPDNLPVKPYDLLHFPGDHQKFNLTVISGKANTFNLEIPSDIEGVTVSADKINITFTNSGIHFIELDIKIRKVATPGLRNFQLNLTSGSEIYDIVNVSLNIRLPEYRILMESYHGLNDWYPEFSFYQMGFYEAMDDLTYLNISIDYDMEYWTPDYNKDTNNSILTEERLAQYDLIMLQNPVLPYSNLEIQNLKNYFNDGGNLLFLGTRYQDLIVENINHLFGELGIDMQVNEENIMNDNWLGIGTRVSSQDVVNFTNSFIFNNVSKFIWKYGNTFNLGITAESIATIDGKSVAAIYNGTDTGRFVAFGDLHWIFNDYKSSGFYQDHQTLLSNLIDYYFSGDKVSINIRMNSERTSDSQFNITLFLKDQALEKPITNSDYDSLNLAIKMKNDSFYREIDLGLLYANFGIYFNNTFSLPYPSYNSYQIELNLTIGTETYSKYSKILYYDITKIPQIIGLYSSKENVTRASIPSQTIDLIAELDKPSYGPIDGFLSLYSYSFYNSKQTINKTLTFNYDSFNNYTINFDPSTSDPSSYAIFYILPINNSYTNPNSPRKEFRIINNPPIFLEEESIFDYGSSSVYFDDIHTASGSYIYRVTQGDKLNFEIAVSDSVDYEDDNANMRIFVNLFIITITNDGYFLPIYPNPIVVNELHYQPTSDIHVGAFTIPSTMQYNSITGTKSKSTAVSFNTATNMGYLGILYITVYDSEGGSEIFLIFLEISKQPFDITMILSIILGIIAVIFVFGLGIYLKRRSNYKRVSQQEYYYQTPIEERQSDDGFYEPISPLSGLQQATGIFCPFCGHHIKVAKKFCPRCGESLKLLFKD